MIDLKKLKDECDMVFKRGIEIGLHLGRGDQRARREALAYDVQVQVGVMAELIQELEEWRKMEFRVAGPAKGEDEWLTPN